MFLGVPIRDTLVEQPTLVHAVLNMWEFLPLRIEFRVLDTYLVYRDTVVRPRPIVEPAVSQPSV